MLAVLGTGTFVFFFFFSGDVILSCYPCYGVTFKALIGFPFQLLAMRRCMGFYFSSNEKILLIKVLLLCDHNGPKNFLSGKF